MKPAAFTTIGFTVICLLTFVLYLDATPAQASTSLAVKDLRCEYRVNPTGIDVLKPRLSWILDSSERAQRQTAFRILVGSSLETLKRDQGDLWDSGKVVSDQTVQIAYAGEMLRSRAEAWWQVQVWDKDGRRSAWSSPSHWTMGLLQRSDWQAHWITDPNLTTNSAALPAGRTSLPAAMLRKEFRLDHPIKRATAYATALGLYELRINGQRVGQQLLAPEWTSYSNRVQYQTYDVTTLVQQGSNAIGALVGEGWYAGRLMAVGRGAYGTFQKFLMQLEVEFQDGTREAIVTDDFWRSTSNGPIQESGIYDGETFDAGRLQEGWDRPGFNDRGWTTALVSDLDSRKLVWQRNEPIEVEQEIPARSVTEPKPGVYVFDLGQNMVGWCRIHAKGASDQTVTMRFAEALNDDGTIYTANLRGAQQIDHYIPPTAGEFSVEPHFTYHGFQYVELSGLSAQPGTEAVVGRVFHSSSPLVGQFECSDPSLNRLMQNIVWTERANLMSSPNDCPQRDERFGWMGDIQAFSQTAMFNMDLAAFFTKFAQDTRDDQAQDGRFPDFAPHPGDPNKQFSGAPAWADAGVLVPWCAYQNYADKRLLAEQFGAARRWVDYIQRTNPDLVWIQGRNNDYNDWLNGDWVKQQNWPTKGGSIPNEVFATAFFAHSCDVVAKMAAVLGFTEQAERYQTLFKQIRTTFQAHFVSTDGKIQGDTQAGYALALAFDLLPEQVRQKAAEQLVASIQRYHGHLSTGIQTTHRAMLELTKNGYNDVAWQLLTNRTFPSWLYMLDNGATTIWERWDGYVKGRGFQDPGMNSLNHWAFGAVGEWMWRNIVGLNPDESQPGWKHFLIEPKPGGGVAWAKGEYNSIHGPIKVAWKSSAGEFTLDALIPPNTTATVVLPAEAANQITEGNRPLARTTEVRLAHVQSGHAMLEIGSGDYHFAVRTSYR